MKSKTLLSSIIAVLLTGCSLSTPTTQPNTETAEIIADRDYYVVVTHAFVADDFSDACGKLMMADFRIRLAERLLDQT